jgi:hypothetical protein
LKVKTREIIAFAANYFKTGKSPTLREQYFKIWEKYNEHGEAMKPAEIKVRESTYSKVEQSKYSKDNLEQLLAGARNRLSNIVDQESKEATDVRAEIALWEKELRNAERAKPDLSWWEPKGEPQSELLVLNKYKTPNDYLDPEWIKMFIEKFSDRINSYTQEVFPDIPVEESPEPPPLDTPPVVPIVSFDFFSNLAIPIVSEETKTDAAIDRAEQGWPESKSSFSEGANTDTESEPESVPESDISEVSVKDIHQLVNGKHNYEAKEKCAKCGKACKIGDEGVIRSMILEKDGGTAKLWCCTKCCEDDPLDDEGRTAQRRQDQ